MVLVGTPDVPAALRVMAWIHLAIAAGLAVFGIVLAVAGDAGAFGIATVFAFALTIGALSVYWIRRARQTTEPEMVPVDR